MYVVQRTTLISAAAALFLALFAGGCGKEGQSAASASARPAPEVAVQAVAPEPLVVTTELPGRTSAFLVAEVRPQVGGILQRRLFEEGSDVAAGQVLYEIDPGSFRADHANAAAALARAKANHAGAKAAHTRANAALANAKAAHSRADAARADAKAALVRAEANAVPVRLKAKRFEELAAIHAVSRQEADDASAAAQLAEAQIESAKAAVRGSEAGIEGAEAAVQAAEAEIEGASAAVIGAEAGIESATAALETAQINLSRTQITAPISGRIGKSSVTVGALVVANQGAPLATIQQIDTVYVDVTQSAADLLKLRQSLARGELKSASQRARVKLRFEDGSSYPLAGRLEFSDAMVDPGTGSVTLRTVFPNPKHELLPGMYVRATIEEGENEEAILIPQRAVGRDTAGNPQVMVVGADEKVEARRIKVDRTVGDRWLVSEGLRAGDRVILEGIQRAPAGTVVRTVPFGGTPDAARAPGK